MAIRRRWSPPHPGPDLTTPARQSNDVRLLRAAYQLDEISDAAHGKLVRDEIEYPWLRVLAAADYGGAPSELLTRVVNLFGDELEMVRRARNSVQLGEPIDDDNINAAADIAEQIIRAAKAAGAASKGELS